MTIPSDGWGAAETLPQTSPQSKKILPICVVPTLSLELRERKLWSLSNTIFKNVELVMVKHIGNIPFVGITSDVITLKGNVLRVPVVCISIFKAPHFAEFTPLYNVADVVSSFECDGNGGSDFSDSWYST